jgi:hypothetical protein
MLRAYLRLVVFAVGLLAGVQVPGFVDQYAKRVSAHYLEVQHNFAGFQRTADQYFGGSVDALITHHSSSSDAVFRDEAKSIAAMYARLRSLSAELEAMRGSPLARLLHVATNANREILQETTDAYSYTVPLDASAILYGVCSALLLSLVIETIVVGGFSLLRRELFRATSTRSPPPAAPARRREPSFATEPEPRKRAPQGPR